MTGEDAESAGARPYPAYELKVMSWVRQMRNMRLEHVVQYVGARASAVQ
jgi:hypothetical protein